MRLRARPRLTWLLLAALAGAAAACGDDPPPRRKELLRPDETLRRRAEELEKSRIFDAQGELIPSGELVAGLEMPRGLKLFRQTEREHYFDAPRISIEQLERYFAPRLEPSGMARAPKSLTFEGAKIKDAPEALPVTLRMARVDSSETASELMLRTAPPPRVFPSQEEVERQLAERRKYAQ